jgi:hypothetical protein
MTFIERPISAVFIALCVLLIVAQIYFRFRQPKVVAELPELPALQRRETASPPP